MRLVRAMLGFWYDLWPVYRQWRPVGEAPARQMRRRVDGAWQYRDMTPEEADDDDAWWAMR